MKKLLSMSLALAMVLTLFVGCGKSGPAASSNNAPAASASSAATSTPAPAEDAMPTLENPATIDAVEFVGGPSNGGWAMISAAIADKANPYFEGFPITATTGGAVANPAVMVAGDAQIGLTQSLFLNKLLAGEVPYEAPSDDLRAIASLESTAMYFIVDASCPYNTLGELIDAGYKTKVGAMVASAASSIVGEMILQEYGLSGIADLQDSGEVYVADGSALYDAYGDRHFDLLIVNKSTSDASLKELLGKRDSKILGIDEKVINSMHDKYGWGSIAIPGGTYAGNDADVTSISIKSILVVHKDVPDALAYVLAKVVCEEKPYLETVQASYKAFGVEDMVQNTVVDMHPGALKYWQEAGLIK